MKPETRFRQSQVLPFLKTLKNSHFFPIQQVGISGTPDILGSMSGIFVAIELKSRGGKPSPLQIFQMERVRESGGIALLVDPDNWKQVKCLLQKLNQGEKI